jgi:uncharacterized protein YjbI with pentapeptide repeats
MPNADRARVDFSQAEVKGDLIADTVTLGGGADFEAVRTKDDCSFNSAVFCDRVSFRKAQFSDLSLTDCTFTRSKNPKDDLDFTGLTVNSCYFDGAVFDDARIR